MRILVSVLSLLALAGCAQQPQSSTPAIELVDADSPGAYIRVTGLTGAQLDALEEATPELWAEVFKVAVDADAPGMLGSYAIERAAARFTPSFPLDPGRQYQVTFDASRLPGAATAAKPLAAVVGRPAVTAEPSTIVTRIYPTGDLVPENLLRMYIEFSAPMGNKSGVEYLKVLNEAGEEIPGAVLPLDYQFWSPDHRRFTVFFDPGRVKAGILPNREMGRPLTYGGAMTLVVSAEWRDAEGQPLKEEYRRTFRVGPADTEPLDPANWTIEPPRASTRTPVVVRFPEPLDHGLLMRALGIRRNGEALPGEITVDQNETRWSFTPEDSWRAGNYELLALEILEDLAGNQIGRAFEVDTFNSVDRSPEPQTITVPFAVR